MESDEILMARAAGGDADAFGRIVRTHQQSLLRFGQHMLGDQEAARDVVQDSFVRIWQSRASYKPSGSFVGYLMRVVRNVCIDRIRANRKWDSVQIGDDFPTAGSPCEALVESYALHEAIERVLLRLPETQRVVFVLSEYEKMTYQEIAEVVGCPYGTVASRKFAAMEALRAHLRPWMDEEDVL